MKIRSALFAGAWLASVVASAVVVAEPKADLVGRAIADFSLRDAGNKAHSLAELGDKQAIVVAFLGVECPLAKLYAGRLNEMAKKYADKGVAFVGIDANQQDSLAELQNFVRVHELAFPVLKDNDARVADMFGAERTPQAFVLDRERVVKYAGRIDDQYGYDRGVGYQRPKATTHELTDAIEQVLQGQPVVAPRTATAGCIIGRRREPQADSPVTYSNQIARIMQARCQECHRPGEIGPFPLLTYDDALGWGEMIREVVQEERMPPWGADSKHGKFLNDARLSDEEKRLIAQWVENGCPEGDRSQLPPARQFVEGWAIPKPDQVVLMGEKAKIPAEGTVEYQYYEVDPGWKEDVWVKAAEARPGNRGVVHHIIVFIKGPEEQGGLGGPSGLGPTNLLAGYAPGTPPMRGYDRGYARHIKAGSKLIFQMHYTPNGTEQEDESLIGLVYADPKEVTHDVRSGFALQLNLDIPPHADDYVARSKYTFRKDSLLMSFMPHMHWRGKSFRYEVEYPDGQREILLNVPRYDFNWQLVYVLSEPKFMPKGSVLRCEAHYDNSAANLANPDPAKRVRWGDQTWEEMMIGWFVSTEAGPDDKPKGEPQKKIPPALDTTASR